MCEALSCLGYGKLRKVVKGVMNTDKFISLHETEWQKFRCALGNVPVERLTIPLPGRQWSLKDILAHITWHEIEMIGMIKAREVTGSPHWQLTTDDRNHQIFLQNKNRELSDVLTEAERVHQELMAALAGVSDEELNNSVQWKNWPESWTGEWTPWKVIASNTYEHYADHLNDLTEQR